MRHFEATIVHPMKTSHHWNKWVKASFVEWTLQTGLLQHIGWTFCSRNRMAAKEKFMAYWLCAPQASEASWGCKRWRWDWQSFWCLGGVNLTKMANSNRLCMGCHWTGSALSAAFIVGTNSTMHMQHCFHAEYFAFCDHNISCSCICSRASDFSTAKYVLPCLRPGIVEGGRDPEGQGAWMWVRLVLPGPSRQGWRWQASCLKHLMDGCLSFRSPFPHPYPLQPPPECWQITSWDGRFLPISAHYAKCYRRMKLIMIRGRENKDGCHHNP